MRVYGVKEISVLKGVTVQAVYRAARRNILKPMKTVNGSRVMAFQESEVQKYLKVHRGGGGTHGTQPSMSESREPEAGPSPLGFSS